MGSSAFGEVRLDRHIGVGPSMPWKATTVGFTLRKVARPCQYRGGTANQKFVHGCGGSSRKSTRPRRGRGGGALFRTCSGGAGAEPPKTVK